jgi:amino acid adenylation domain-containing protein
MEIVDAYPLSRLQAGMLFHSAYGEERGTYQDILSLELEGLLDIDVLQGAVDTVVRRHDTLRTAFDVTTFTEATQLVFDAVECPVHYADLRGMTAQEQVGHLEEWFEEQKARKLDWSTAPLARFYAHALADDRFQLGLVFHHAILDGWSLASLVTELVDLCAGVAPADGAVPSVSMRDYIRLERAALADANTRAFWAEMLDDRPFTAIPRWPSDHAGEHDRIGLDVPGDVREKLEQFAGELGVPIRAVLLTAHLEVLSLLAGQQDVLTGVVTHGRPEVHGGDQVLGLFLNTVPLRARTGWGTWREAVRRTFEAEARAVPHRRYPLAQMQRDHSGAGNPLFEVAFDFRNFHVSHALPSGGDLRTADTRFFEQNNFPLTVSASQDPDALQVNFTYSPREFPPDQIRYIAGYYDSALRRMASAPDELIHGRDLLPEGERDRLPRIGNDTAAEFPDESLDQLVQKQAHRNPHRVAVTAEDGELTYADLVEQAARLAAHLASVGVAPGDLVGVCMDRTKDLVVALLGVLKAGAAYVPLDPRYPSERLAYMISDAGLDVMLTQAHIMDSLPTGPSRVILVDEVPDHRGPPATAAPAGGSSGFGLAYVIYTSGSTGRPKGVMVPHRCVVNLVTSIARQTGCTDQDVILASTSLSFDIAALEIFLPLLTGARLVIGRDLLFDTDRAVAAFNEKPTLIQATPSGWRLLLDLRHDLPATTKVLCGGEALPRDLAARLAETFTTAWNVYGPTETTIWSSADLLKSGEDPTLGYPVANTQLHVLGTDLDLVPLGTTGELFIGGSGVSTGYLGRPGLTAERFLPDPFSDRPGARIYRTGDRARREQDGRIQFQGRVDGQIKLRGHRIELGEVESVVVAHPEIRAAAARLWEEESGDHRLVCYLVPDSGGTCPTVSELREYVAAKLPSSMVPTVFEFLEALPLTPNGKVDRRALPAPGRARPELANKAIAPRDLLEHRVAAIWADALRRDSVGIHDDFFELGGDSLLALRLLTMVRQQFDVELPATLLFERATVAAMATAIGTHASRQAGSVVRMHPGSGATPVFCVHPLGGHVFCYRELAVHLGDAGHPFYALQAPGLAQGEPLATIEELAAHYIKEIREVQPHGPYALAGWCMGGLVVFEMARQLDVLGERVELLAIISANFDRPVPELYAHDDIKLMLDVVYGGGLEISHSELSAVPPAERASVLVTFAQSDPEARPDIDSAEQLERVTRLYRTNARALLAYQPERYRGDAVLYRPADGPEGLPPDLGWSAVITGKLRIEPVGGDHYSMLTGSHGRELAECILRDMAATASSAAGNGKGHRGTHG